MTLKSVAFSANGKMETEVGRQEKEVGKRVKARGRAGAWLAGGRRFAFGCREED